MQIFCRWKDLIEGCPKLYRHLILDPNKHFHPVQEHYRKLKFEKVHCCFFNPENDVTSLVQEILELHRYNVKDIQFQSIPVDILENLWKLENLERIKIEHCHDITNGYKGIVMTFNHLKKLSMKSIDFKYFKVIAPNLEELAIINSFQGIEFIKEFFPKLRVLDVMLNFEYHGEDVMLEAIPQKLHSLLIRNYLDQNTAYYMYFQLDTLTLKNLNRQGKTVNAMKLLESQHDNLKELKIYTNREE